MKGLLIVRIRLLRKREVALAVPTKLTAFTTLTELRIVTILDRKNNRRAVKHNNFELRNIAFDEKEFPWLF